MNILRLIIIGLVFMMITHVLHGGIRVAATGKWTIAVWTSVWTGAGFI